MMRILVLVSATFLLIGLPHAQGSDWIFKGQPKDGSAQYDSSAAQDRSRAQQRNLLDRCDKMMRALASGGDTQRLDRETRRSLMRGLASCGLVYGAEHEREKANVCYNRSLELADSLGDRTEQAQILNYSGIGHALWGQFAIALDCHRRSLELSTGTADYQNQVISWNQIGHIAMVMGDYRKASDALKRAVALQARTAPGPWSPLPLDTLGHLNAAWGNYDKALEWYRQALETKKRLGLTGGEAASYILLGRVYKLLGRDEDALNAFWQSLKLCEKHGYPTDLGLDEIGNLYLDYGNTDKAEAYIKRAGFWQSLGRLYLMKGNLAEAEGNYIKLRHYSEQRRMLDYLWVACTGLGVIKEQKGDLQSAAEQFRTAIGYIESSRTSLTQPERAEFFNVQLGGFFRTAPYEGLARVLMKMNKPAEAFRASELTKARAFSEGLSRRSPNATMALPEKVMATDAALNQRLAAVTRALHTAYEKEDGKSIAILEPQVLAAKEKLAAHVARLRTRFPMFAATRYPEPMNLDQTALGDDEWVLAYDVTDTGIIGYLLKGKKIVNAVFKPVARSEIDSLVRKLREPLEIDSGDVLAEKLRVFNFAAGRRLSDILLRDILSDLPKNAPVIVVPDDSLGVLPFEMLVLKEGGTVKTDGAVPTISGAEFFGDRNPVSYYQSVTALTVLRTLRKQQKPSERLLAMVDPVFSINDQRLARIARKEKEDLLATLPTELLTSIEKQTGITFPRLPLTGELGEDLKRTDPQKTDLYEGLQASKKVLFKTDLRVYGSAVFATHGYFGKALPGIREPVMVLTLVDKEENGDGFLRLTEVMGLKMNCDIVALTACQTGLGRQVFGEGTMGMGRAFQYAGSRSVLMSLWSVAETSSVALVKDFFKHVHEGRNKLDALKLARETIRKEGYDHPFFWAPFILVGEVD